MVEPIATGFDIRQQIALLENHYDAFRAGRSSAN